MLEPYTAARTLTDSKLQAFQNDIANHRNKSKQLDRRRTNILNQQHDLITSNRHGGVDTISHTSPSGSDIIKLNVGGTQMRVRRDTLTLIEGSRLEMLFSGRWEDKLLRDGDGNVFMDVDPTYFEKIIEYLYVVKVHCKEKETDTSDRKQVQLPEMPKLDGVCEQKVFDLYVEFFRLGSNEKKGPSPFYRTSMNDQGKESHAASKEEEIAEGTSTSTSTSYEDIINAFRREKEELKKEKKRVDKMEEELGRDQDFISFFTAVSNDDNEKSFFTAHGNYDNKGDVEEVLHIDNDDDYSFATMSSNSSSISNSREITSDNINTTIGMSDDDILSLWVYGQVIPVKLSTICQCKGSQLATNFTDVDWMKEHSFRCDDGAVLIKVDHTLSAFKLIINRLRLRAMMTVVEGGKGKDGGVPPIAIYKTNEMTSLKEVVSKLFQGKEDFILGSCVDYSIDFASQIIVSNKNKEHIRKWLAEVGKTSEPELLYRASRDGWEASEFHFMCDNKGAKITIVKTSEGYVFGGYSDQSWAGNGSYKSSDDAFMFSLKCHAGLAPTKMKLMYGKNSDAVYCKSDCGPCFGAGHDLSVGGSGYYNALNLKSGYTTYNNTYELPTGALNSFLTGKHGSGNRFEVAEVEVFDV